MHLIMSLYGAAGKLVMEPGLLGRENAIWQEIPSKWPGIQIDDWGIAPQISRANSVP